MEEWPYTDRTPYEVLGLSSTAGIAEVRTAFKRMALETHPDKRQQQQHCTACNSNEAFHIVKRAADILCDAVLRQRYHLQHSQAMIRSVGAFSDRYTLRYDFDLVVKDASLRVYQRECRCGGVYEVYVSTSGPAAASTMCECDCCSLVVEVVCSPPD